jgi:hypothetical protein
MFVLLMGWKGRARFAKNISYGDLKDQGVERAVGGCGDEAVCG